MIHRLPFCYLISQLYEFHKCAIPDNQEEMAVFAENLAGFGVSLEQYKCSLLMEDITMYVGYKKMVV